MAASHLLSSSFYVAEPNCISVKPELHWVSFAEPPSLWSIELSFITSGVIDSSLANSSFLERAGSGVSQHLKSYTT